MNYELASRHKKEEKKRKRKVLPEVGERMKLLALIISICSGSMKVLESVGFDLNSPNIDAYEVIMVIRQMNIQLGQK